MFSAAITSLKPKCLTIGTQISNFPSINLFQSQGFRVIEAKYIFHFHKA